MDASLASILMRRGSAVFVSIRDLELMILSKRICFLLVVLVVVLPLLPLVLPLVLHPVLLCRSQCSQPSRAPYRARQTYSPGRPGQGG